MFPALAGGFLTTEPPEKLPSEVSFQAAAKVLCGLRHAPVITPHGSHRQAWVAVIHWAIMTPLFDFTPKGLAL